MAVLEHRVGWGWRGSPDTRRAWVAQVIWFRWSESQVGCGHSAVLEEKWKRSCRITQKMLKCTNWRYLIKTPKWVFAYVKVDQCIFHILYCISWKSRRRSHTITGEEDSLCSHMKDFDVRKWGKKKSESLSEIFLNWNVLLTLSPAAPSAVSQPALASMPRTTSIKLWRAGVQQG